MKPPTSPLCLTADPGPHITSSHSMEPTLPKSPPSQLMKRRLLRGRKPRSRTEREDGPSWGPNKDPLFVFLCPGPLGSLSSHQAPAEPSSPGLTSLTVAVMDCFHVDSLLTLLSDHRLTTFTFK